MLGHLLFGIFFYNYLSLTIFSKILCIILVCETYFFCLFFDVVKRSTEDYFRGDWVDDVVEGFLDSFEDDSLFELNMFLHWLQSHS